MIEVINNFFHLQNEKVSYIFYVMENGQLGHAYYGSPLGKLSSNEIQYLIKTKNKSSGTVNFFDDGRSFSLSDHFQEYPAYGTSDFKEGVVEVFQNSEPWYLDFKYTGYKIYSNKPRDLFFPSTYALEREAETLTVFLKDEEHHLDLELEFSIFKEFSAVARRQKLMNSGKKTVYIKRMLSGVLELSNKNYELLHLSGAGLKERHIKKRKLEQGVISIGSLKGASGHQHNPFIALVNEKEDLNCGNAYAMNLIYSGNFLTQVEVDEWDNIRLMTGINPSQFSWELQAHEKFVTPESIIFFSDEGYNGLSRQTGKFAEKHIIDRKWTEKARPIVFNNWEATYFNFNSGKLLNLADESKKLGVECFVVDDGWFSNRNNSRSSLGDWFYDSKKFPEGLREFANEIHKKDLKLGIWFEPEMVSPDSQFYQNHPNWIVGHPYSRLSMGRGQYVLDFSNPEVVENIYNQMKKIILETNLDYIKWDMNRNITEAYSNYLKINQIPQTEFFHRYIVGVYKLYGKILSEFPNILIEGCAGGGGRYDLGILFYSPQIWPSDNSDAIERLSIQQGTLLAYPLSSFSNHISAVPNHQVGRITSLEMRQNVSLFGSLGYELDVSKLTSEEKELIKEKNIFYKAHRKLLIHGDFYQILNPTNNQNEVSYGVISEDKSEAIIGFYRKLATPNPPVEEHLKIPFLSDDKVYIINGDEKISGKILKYYGLKKPYQYNGTNHEYAEVQGDFQSYIYHLIAYNKEKE